MDGLGFGMFLLSALLTLIAVAVSWDVRENLKMYYAMLLIAEVGMLGVFAAQDLVLFYIFFEVTLVPMYLMVGIWGDENRRRSAIKFFIYTFFGSTIMLAGFPGVRHPRRDLLDRWPERRRRFGPLRAGSGCGPDTFRVADQGSRGPAA